MDKKEVKITKFGDSVGTFLYKCLVAVLPGWLAVNLGCVWQLILGVSRPPGWSCAVVAHCGAGRYVVVLVGGRGTLQALGMADCSLIRANCTALHSTALHSTAPYSARCFEARTGGLYRDGIPVHWAMVSPCGAGGPIALTAGIPG